MSHTPDIHCAAHAPASANISMNLSLRNLECFLHVRNTIEFELSARVANANCFGWQSVLDLDRCQGIPWTHMSEIRNSKHSLTTRVLFPAVSLQFD